MYPATQIWTPVEVALTYRLGEIQIFSVILKGVARRTHFSVTKPYVNFPAPQSESAPASDFYFYPSYPIAFEPPRLERRGDWLIYTPYVFNNYYVDLKAIGDFDGYLKHFSSKSRSTLLRKLRKFEQAGGGATTWRVFKIPDELDEFFSLAVPLSERTYQSRLLDSGLPASTKFMEQAKAASAQGCVRAYLLFLKDKPAAYVFCYLKDGIVSYDYVGYDSTLSSLSPGTVLQYLILRQLFSDPDCSIFDFTEGEGAQKQLFGSASQRCAKSYFLRRSIKIEVLLRMHVGLNDFVEGVGKLLERMGIKARVRRMIRGTGQPR